jgi:hypothetical protein
MVDELAKVCLIQLTKSMIIFDQMVDLFGRDKSVISRHLRNIFKTKTLDNRATVALFATVQEDISL